MPRNAVAHLFEPYMSARDRFTHEKLPAFTETFHDRLPIEIRLNTYDLVLDDETTKDLATTLRGHEHVPSLNFCLLYGAVAQELVKRFYETLHHDVPDSYTLPTYLQTDHFAVSIRSCDVTLSNLRTVIDLEPTVMPDLFSDLHPFFSPSQTWTTNFTLHLVLFFFPADSPEYIPKTLTKTAQMLDTLAPIVSAVREKSATASFRVTLNMSDDPNELAFWPNTLEEYRTFTEEEFSAKLKDLVENRDRQRKHRKHCHYQYPMGPGHFSIDDVEGDNSASSRSVMAWPGNSSTALDDEDGDNPALPRPVKGRSEN